MINEILAGLRASAEVTRLLAESKEVAVAIDAVAKACHSAFQSGNKVILVGNGGSAADCQHIAGELVARFNFDRPGLPALALTVDSSVITAIGNDYGYDRIFARQIEAVGTSGDVLFAYSTSGNSRNVILAIDAARRRKMTVVGFTGLRDSPITQGLCDHVLRTPSIYTPHIQEGHLVMGHLLCQLIESSLFGKFRPK